MSPPASNMQRPAFALVEGTSTSELLDSFADGAGQIWSPREDRNRTKAVLETSLESTNEWIRRLKDRLYATLTEDAELLDMFENVQGSQQVSLFLIHGEAGTGKTRIAKDLQRPIEQRGGYFIRGKFDCLRRPAPYTAFVAAFTEFTNMVLASGGQATDNMRKSINNAVGEEASILTSMIPSLELILGNQNQPTRKAKTRGGMQRFIFVFRSFLRAVCSPKQPLVLLLDDLHFADNCSLDLLSSIVTDNQNKGLYIIGTCQDELISHDSYLAVKIRGLEDKDNVMIYQLFVQSMKSDAVADFLLETFNTQGAQSGPLARIIFEQTEGNIFFLTEFLRWLRLADLLTFDNESGLWTWDIEDIRATIRNMERPRYFLVDIFQQLPDEIKELLKVAACLGPHLDEELLQYVMGVPIQSTLTDAACRGVIVADDARGGFAFEHDALQEAAYRLIPEEERELFHLEVGRRMWRKLNPEELEVHIFTLLSQMNLGRRLIYRKRERVAVSTLCLHAGTKAAKSSTFRTAAIYLKMGISLLDEESWQENYDLALSLHNAAAEMEMCTANFEGMEALVNLVFFHATNFRDKVQAYATKIYALGVSERQEEAIDMAIEVLEELGESFSPRLSSGRLKTEMKRVNAMLRSKSDTQLLRMPIMSDEDKLSCLQIINLILLPSWTARPEFAPFAALKGMTITMKYGLSVFASSMFAAYGMFHSSTFSDADVAFRYGELSLVLLNRFEAKEFLPRVYAMFYGSIYWSKRPLKDVLQPLLDAYKTGMQTGDIEFACLSANLYCAYAMEAGVPLGVINKEWLEFQGAMESNRQKSLLAMALPGAQNVRHFMGLTENPLSGKGDMLDFDEEIERYVNDGNVLRVTELKISALVRDNLFNNTDLKNVDLDELFKYIRFAPPTFERVSFLFICTITALQCARAGIKKQHNINLAKQATRKLKGFAVHTPHNVLDKLYLIEAELASLSGKNREAYEKYLCAIGLANEFGFTYVESYANELAARHAKRINDLKSARRFFTRACEGYLKWDAFAKYQMLQAEVDGIFSVNR